MTMSLDGLPRLLKWSKDLIENIRPRRGQFQRIISDNFENVWNTRGIAIMENWKGNDLVKTGRLRRSLTSGTIDIDDYSGRGLITISITATPPYASYVNKKYKFMELTEETKRDLFRSYLGKYKG